MLVNFVLVAGMTLIMIIITFLLRFRKQLPYRLLSVFFASIFLFLLYYFGYLHRSRYIGGIAFLFGNGAGLLWGPLFLHYIRSLAFPRKQVLRSLAWHLIPFGLNFILINVPQSMNMFAGLFPAFEDWYIPLSDYFNIAENCYVIVYFLVCLRFIYRLNRLYTNSYSDTEGKDLAWCRQLISVLTIFIFLDVVFSVYELNYPRIDWNIGMIPAFLVVGLSAFFAYKGMWQAQTMVPEFLLERTPRKAQKAKEQLEEEDGILDPASKNHSALNLSEEEIAALKERLYDVLETEKPYLNDSLTLADLAALIPISDKKLSELLNKHVCISFYDLINNYRVETVKEKMRSREAEQFTLLAIGFDSGFKSKTSFNRVFKQKTGVSPSQYYDLCREGQVLS